MVAEHLPDNLDKNFLLEREAVPDDLLLGVLLEREGVPDDLLLGVLLEREAVPDDLLLGVLLEREAVGAELIGTPESYHVIWTLKSKKVVIFLYNFEKSLCAVILNS